MKNVLNLRNVVITILIIAGLGLIFNAPIRNFLIQQKSDEYKITKVTKEEIQENKEAESSFDFAAVQPVSTDEVLKSRWIAQKLPVIGGIAIPELKINLPIFKGVDNVALMYGAGTMKEGQEMGKGNYSLASHHIFGVSGSADVLFSPLERAKEGMKIYITDKDKVYTYTIKSIEVVTPDSIHVIEDAPGESEITLVTCTDFYATNRIVVKGDLTGEVNYSDISKEVSSAFGGDYNQYNYE